MTRDWRRWWIAGVAFAPFIVASVYMSAKPVPTKLARTHGGSAADFSTNPYLDAEGGRFRRTAVHMGTDWTVEVVALDEQAGEAALDAAFAEVSAVEARISEWKPDSEVSRINRGAGAAVAVSADTFAMIELALGVAAETGGSFDPTFLPLSLVWRIEAGDARAEVPPDEEIAAARAHVGFRRVTVDKAATSVALGEGMSLGVGGIGKGWAAGRVGSVLEARGITRYLIDAGGDVLAGAGPSSGQSWKVAVAGPGGETIETVELTHAAVATSGDAQRFREIGGVRYSHIIDPRTGRPAAKAASVTVRHKDPAMADAYATAAAVLGPEEALKFADRKEGLELLVVLPDGAVQKSAGFSSP